MQSVSKLTNLHGKKVILRLDLNVPLKNGEITDTTRIDKVLPTIDFLLNLFIALLSAISQKIFVFGIFKYFLLCPLSFF